MTRLLTALVATLAVLATPSPSSANGRFPNAQHVWRSPSDGTMVLRATWGFAFVRPAATPRWACEDALGYGGEFDPPFVIDARGGVWLGLYDGLVRVSPDRCGITRLPALQGENVADLDASPDGRHLVLVENTLFTSATRSVVARLWRSDDGGDTWGPTAAVIRDALLDTVEMSRSDPQRVYMTGREARSAGVRFLRSDDGGAQFRGLEPDWSADAESAFIAGVAPDDPDRVFVRVVLRPAAAGGALDVSALYRSDDGGERWRRVRTFSGPMAGFALHDDGRTVWAGGPDPLDGLQRSRDGGETWESLPRLPLRCLRWAGGALYACLDAARSPEAALARSDDLGESFSPMLDPCDLRPGTGCTAGTDPAAVCASLLSSTRAFLGCPRAPRDAGGIATCRRPATSA